MLYRPRLLREASPKAISRRTSYLCVRLEFHPAHSSIGTPSLSLRLLVDIRFQVLFHSPPGVLFTVPSWYYALSVAIESLALEGGPPCFPQDSSCPVVLWIPASNSSFSRTGLLPSLALLAGPQPRTPEGARFRLCPLRSPLLGASRLISSPPAT